MPPAASLGAQVTDLKSRCWTTSSAETITYVVTHDNFNQKTQKGKENADLTDNAFPVQFEERTEVA